MPLTAVCFALIPRAETLVALLLATVLMNLGMSVFSSPSLALMPDITPTSRRGRANGIINLMGGLGALVGFMALGPLYDRAPTLPFDTAGVLLLLATVAVVLLVPERQLTLVAAGAHAGPEASLAAPGSEGALRPRDLGGLGTAVRSVATAPGRRVLFLLLGSLFWVAAVNGAQNMFTRFGVEHWGLTPSGATLTLGAFALAFIVGAVPAGLVGDRLGRVRTIRAGIAGTLLAFVLLPFLPGPAAALPVLVLGGLSWALIITNAYPILTDLVPPERAGAYTGLWNVVIGVAGLISPPLYGAVVDRWGFGAFFLPGIAFLALAMLCSLRLGADAPAAARLPATSG